MNLYRLLGPDAPAGRLLLRGRAAAQLLGMRARGRGWDPEFARLVRQLAPRYTMLSPARLRSLYDLGAVAGAMPRGAIVECGVWNGGSSAALAAGCARTADPAALPAVWLFDSFAGLPEPTERDESRVRTGYFSGWCTGSIARVREALAVAGYPEQQVHIVPGWFEDTLAASAAQIGPIGLLHIDADWYDSVSVVLRTLYPQVLRGGTVVIDDYGRWSGCREAVHTYFDSADRAAPNMVAIDRDAVYFRKP